MDTSKKQRKMRYKRIILTLNILTLIFLIGTALLSFSAILSNELSFVTKLYYLIWICIDISLIYAICTFIGEILNEK